MPILKDGPVVGCRAVVRSVGFHHAAAFKVACIRVTIADPPSDW